MANGETPGEIVMLYLSDHILVIIFAVLFPAYGAITYPKFKRDAAAGKLGARLNAYRETIIIEWILAGGAVFVWNSSQRPFDGLGLGLPLHWRFWTGLGVVLLAIAGLILQLRRIQNSEEARNQVRDQLQPVVEILPHDRTEMTDFTVLSLTAGISEEILYRGFLIWYISQFAGLLPAVLLSSVLFGLGHIYQGLQGVMKTAAIGLISALLYILTESLWVPILLHAYVDINSGQMAYLVLRSEESASATV